MAQKILLAAQRKKLYENAKANEKSILLDGDTLDLKPVVKLFCPWGAATWLITEMDEHGRMFGLCDLGMGEPELGYVMLDELTSLRGPFGLKIERDAYWTASKTLSEYSAEATERGRINA